MSSIANSEVMQTTQTPTTQTPTIQTPTQTQTSHLASQNSQNTAAASAPEQIYIDSEDEPDELDSSSDHDVEIQTVRELHHSSKPAEEYGKLRKFTCPICMDAPKQLCVAPCGHAYCGSCVFAALSSGPRATKAIGECSICRKKVHYNKVVFLEARLEKRRDTTKTDGAGGVNGREKKQKQ